MSTENLPQSPDSPSRKPRVAVVFGGRSSEHGISVVTAGAVLNAIDRTKYDVLPIGITQDGRWALTADEPERMAITDRRTPSVDEIAESTEGAVVLPVDPADREVVHSEPGSVPKALGEVDVVFPVLHGPYGEDGTLQGMLELAGVPYVGSGVLGSALCMDKAAAKRMAAAAGLPQVAWLTGRDTEDRAALADRVVAELGLPAFVKPANMGSSVGVTRADDADGLRAALDGAFGFDEWIVVEAAVTAREIEVGVLGNAEPRTSVPGEIVPTHDFYDYDDKYVDGAAEMVIPADLPPAVADEARSLALDAYRALRCDGYARVDLFYEEGRRGLLLNEINTIPGFTPYSMFPRLWEATGLPYADLIAEMVRLGVERHSHRTGFGRQR